VGNLSPPCCHDVTKGMESRGRGCPPRHCDVPKVAGNGVLCKVGEVVSEVEGVAAIVTWSKWQGMGALLVAAM
jgi:hypothetical protein